MLFKKDGGKKPNAVRLGMRVAPPTSDLKTTGKTYKVTLGGSKSAARTALESAGLM